MSCIRFGCFGGWTERHWGDRLEQLAPYLCTGYCGHCDGEELGQVGRCTQVVWFTELLLILSRPPYIKQDISEYEAVSTEDAA